MDQRKRPWIALFISWIEHLKIQILYLLANLAGTYDVFVLSESNEMISTQGEIGELCVRGVGVALGYYGDFERSKEVFVQNPLNNVYQ